MQSQPSRQVGMTFLELMLVITVAGVILSVAVPNIRSFILNSRMTSAANDLLAAIHAARTEAINRRLPVVMCLSTNPSVTASPPNCSGNGTQGWVVFVDDRDPATAEATDNNGVPDTGELIVQRHDALPETVRTRTSPTNTRYVSFSASGFRRDISAVGAGISGVVFCDERGNVPLAGDILSAARGLIVSPTGRPRVTRSVSEISDHSDLGACP